MGRPLYDNAGFLEAARLLASEGGPAAVTVDSVASRLKAPKGSFYHRFASRDVLLGQLWLKLVLEFQVGFVAAIEAGDGLAAALHLPRWAREHMEDTRLLSLYSRHDFVQGDWPDELKKGVREQAERLERCVRSSAARVRLRFFDPGSCCWKRRSPQSRGTSQDVKRRHRSSMS